MLPLRAAGGELPMTGRKNAKGTPIVHMWDCPRPDPSKLGAGYPVLENAEHVEVYHATEESGGYSHHAKLIVHHGMFYAMWSNHPRGEDGPGQFVRFAVSGDGRTWTKPQRLLPRYGEIDDFQRKGPYGYAGGWVVHEDRAYGIMALSDCVGFANPDRSSVQDHRDEEHPFKAREFIGKVARAVDASGGGLSLGPVFALPNTRELMAGEPLTEALAPPNEALDGVARALEDAMEERSPAGARTAVDSVRPCEPVYYRARDGKRVCLLRDDEYSHRMYVSLSDDGETWPAAVPTDIPDSPSLSDAVVLDDGTVLLIGNHVAPKFDNPDEVRHYPRDPLTVSVSEDGYLFTRAYALRTGVQKHRVPNVGGRGRGGGQYPCGLVFEGRLYVLYSMGKEDIWISSVGLGDLGLDGRSQGNGTSGQGG